MFECGGLGARRGLAIDERQVDRAVGVGVGDRRADARVDNLKGDFFAALARQSFAGCLAGLDLSPDELPVSAQRLANRPPAEKITIPSADYAADDFDDFAFRFHLYSSPNVHAYYSILLCS